MNKGFFRVACGAPAVVVADPEANASSIIELIARAYASGAEMLVLPEMCVTAYTCADLFHSRTLLEASAKALSRIAEATTHAPGMLVWVGAPVETSRGLYNCAIALADGRALVAVPKTFIPNYNEFYEKRWWSGAPLDSSAAPVSVELWPAQEGRDVPMSTGILVQTPAGVKVGAEICEDLWAPAPPSTLAALAGAEVIANLSASDDLIGKHAYLRSLVMGQSARTIGAYVYASAGFGESSTDLVFDAKLLVAENGTMLAENKRWTRQPQLLMADVDIEAIRRDRMHIATFADCASRSGSATAFRVVGIPAAEAPARPDADELLRNIAPRPFVPGGDPSLLAARCEEIINIQVAGLSKRLHATHCKCLVIGISGGLDSTLALLVACRAFDSLGLDRKGITGVTMPGFGTTGRTHRNAVTLMETLGVSLYEVSIVPAVKQHFSDIGQNPDVHDVTYENSQARERTQILMDLANRLGGMVLGTGDLSELALGWATYNGDHMSMYGVNSGVPKTLVRHLTKYFADTVDSHACRAALLDVIDTPVSPELLPPTSDGKIAQETEDLVGPYDLHDFFLYYTLRYGFTPGRIYYMARKAFAGEFSDEVIAKWLRVFFRRFFAQQFKRSCLPDGPKVGSVCLSPRGDWRMPSDASSAEWLKGS
ncbi:MAG: NAD(+) synthase [Muribaculaceae bacterium]|nr:NAD(+) synthase [Muribaculaceae bacterium]